MNERNTEKGLLSSGQYLRAARLEQEFTLEQLADRTSLSENTIECLEKDDWLALPAMVYVRGYIRLICRELSLDAREVLALLEEEDVQINRPLIVVDEDRSVIAEMWSKQRPALAVGVAVATVLIGLLTQLIATNGSGETSEQEVQRPDISVESERR